MDNPNQSQPEILDLEDLMKADDAEESKEEIVDETELANRVPVKKEVKSSESEEPEEQEEELKLDEDEEPEDLDLIAPVRKQEILKKYPTLFKDFPHLEKAYYREQKFTEIFPTIDDAKEAQQTVEDVGKIQAELLKGDLTSIIAEVSKADDKAFSKLVDNYLPNLFKVSEKAYFHIVGNLFKDTIQRMYAEGKRTESEPLQAAAVVLNQFTFGTSEFTQPQKLAKEEQKDESLDNERRQFIQEQFESHRDDLAAKVGNLLKATIDANIDPKGSMSPYIKKNAVKDCFEQLEQMIVQDQRFVAIRDRLWDQAFKNRFSRPTMDKIRSAYLSKAKTLLPELIKRTRSEVLRGQGRQVSEEKKERKSNIERSGNTGPNLTSKSEVKRGMTTLDFFNQD